MMKRKIPKEIVIAGITALTIIEVVALLNGIDGVLLSSIVGIISVAIGILVENPFKFK